MSPFKLRLARRAADESGAVAIVTALSLTTLILMASFVLDLAQLRADRTSSQGVADMAASAGAFAYDPTVAGSWLDACEEALVFAVGNLPDLPSPVGAPDCAATFPAAVTCDASTAPQTAVYTAGPYTFRITIPVPDGEPLMAQQSIVGEIDGVPCERVAVEVARDREYILGGVAGFFGANTTRGAIAHSGLGDAETEYSSMIVLRRNGCQTLSNTGGGNIRVFNLVRDEVDDDGNLVEVTYPGTITVDTLPSGCTGGKKVIEARTAAGALVEAKGRIVAHALSSADTGNADTYPASAVPANLRPEPVAGPIITRAPVDHPYNCQTTGYPSGRTWSPQRFGQPISPCEADGAPPPYIERLVTALSPVSDASEALARGWAVYPSAAGETCAGAVGVLDPATVSSSNLFVNCRVGSGPDQFRPKGLHLNGFDNVVFREGIFVGNTDALAVTGTAAKGTVVYIPEKGVDQSGGTLQLQNVFTYVDAPDGSANNERFRSSGNTDRFALQAPLDDSDCSSYIGGAPPASCFAPLAVWSNASAENEITGNGNGGVIGAVFTPNAPIKLRGSSSTNEDPCTATVTWADISTNTGGSLNFESAQFFAEAVNTAGSAVIRMCPSPDSAVEIPLRTTNLIR